MTLSGVNHSIGSTNLSGITGGKHVSLVHEVIPIQYRYREKQIWTYKRIKVECLTTEVLEKLYEEIHSQMKMIVMDSSSYYLIQYPGKPIIMISKENGRLYSFEPSNKEIEHQATFVIRILHKYKLVEDVHTTTMVIKND